VLFNRQAPTSEVLVLPSPPEPVSIDTPGTGRARRLLYPWDVLLPASIVLWVAAIRHIDTSHLGQYGLPAVLPLIFYVGIALVVLSTGWALAQEHLSSVRLTANLGALLLMLYGTAPLLYTAARYSWTYKYIGVVQYINLHGHLNSTIDVYQNWPGFFAFAAWFDKVIGVQSPLAYAKWAQLAFEALTCLMLHFVFRGLPLKERERWLALFLYAASIWIAQDYFSAQALGVVLSTGIFALTLTFLRRETQADWVLALRRRLQPIGKLVRRAPADTSETALLVNRSSSPAQEGAVLAAIGIIYFVLVFEHELSPYVVLIQLGALALIGEVRRRWIAILFAAVAFGYLAPHFTFVNSHFGVLKSIGNFFSNAAPPSSSQGSVPKGTVFSEEASRLLSVGMWGLSAVGALRRWRGGRSTLALVLLAYSPVFVFFAGGYGTEGILRVYLFSLPWTVCLAASALKPRAAHISRFGSLLAPLTLVVVIVLFIPAFFGDDAVNVMPQSDVQGTLGFYQSARPGTIFGLADNFPSDIDGRYNLFLPVLFLYGSGGIITGSNLHVSNAAAFTRVIEKNDPKPNEPSYVLITQSMETNALEYGFLSSSDIADLRTMLKSAPGWFEAYNAHGVTAYELPPGG
jgi:hypothetical protein